MFYFDDFCGYKVLKSDMLNDVTAFFSLRGIDDNPSNEISKSILENKLAKRMLSPVQTHSDNVEVVDSRIEYPDTDGLILKNFDDAISLKFADCTPLIIYDKKQKIGAVSHAGWRGTAKSIGIKTIKKMNSAPKDIIVIIGPAISVCCYEVSEEVKESLLSSVNDRSCLSNGKFVDLKKINARQFEEIGVTKIDICPYCTSCNNDLFYSYRKENCTTQRHRAFLMR